MTVAPRLTHGHERYLVMIEKLVEIHAGLPFAGAQLSLSHRHAEQRQRYIVNGWVDPFFKTRVDRRERKASRRNADIMNDHPHVGGMGLAGRRKPRRLRVDQ